MKTSTKRRFTARLAASGIALATLIGSQAAFAAIIVNGSFETAPSYSAQAAPGAVPNWTVTGDGVEWFQPSNYLNDPTWGPAHDGVSIIDLAYDPGAAGATGGIEQTFGTTAGTSYSLSFYGVTRTGYGRDGTGVANVLINGVPLASALITNLNNGWVAGDWQNFTYNFTASGPFTTLAFANFEDANTNFAFIDDVSVSSAVPEPATWAMMLVGFGMLGAGLRRRKPASTRVKFNYA